MEQWADGRLGESVEIPQAPGLWTGQLRSPSPSGVADWSLNLLHQKCARTLPFSLLTLRQRENHLVLPRGARTWQRLDHMGLRLGLSVWLGNVVLTHASPYPTHLVLHWQPGQTEAWFLATNLLHPQPTLRLYRLRMWIEEMFGDLKKHGFDLERTHLRHFLRLSRLTLVVCLLFIWLVALGEFVLRNKLVGQVDRTDRHDLSIFRLGWDFLEDCLRLLDPIPAVAFANFCSVSAG